MEIIGPPKDLAFVFNPSVCYIGSRIGNGHTFVLLFVVGSSNLELCLNENERRRGRTK